MFPKCSLSPPQFPKFWVSVWDQKNVYFKNSGGLSGIRKVSVSKILRTCLELFPKCSLLPPPTLIKVQYSTFQFFLLSIFQAPPTFLPQVIDSHSKLFLPFDFRLFLKKDSIKPFKVGEFVLKKEENFSLFLDRLIPP